MLCGGQNRFFELLQTSYTLCSGQKGPCVHLKASYTFCGGQRGLCRSSYTLCGGQSGLSLCRPPNFYRPSTRFAVVKIDSRSFYKPPKRFVLIKTYYPNFIKLPIRFAVVKRNSRKFCKPPTRFVVIKTDFPNFYMASTCLRWSKETLWTSISFLHASRKLKRTTTTLIHALRWSNGLSELPNFHKHPACIAAVETGSLRFLNFYKPPACFWKSKQTLRTTTRLIHTFHCLNVLSELP